MANVIRQDVIRIGFDIDNSPLKKLNEQMKKLESITKSSVGGDTFQDMTDNSKKAKKGVEGVNDAMEKTKKSTDKAKKGMKEFANTSTDKLKNGLKKISSQLGDIGKKAASISFKALTGGLIAATTAIGGLVVKSVSAYAEFEQLKGGVETLFGTNGAKSVEEYAKLTGKSVEEVKDKYASLETAQKTVLKNASSAFMTSGLSANDYMSSVTSFSASLISSVKGDTVLAAKMADSALVDMADNANKMGTDMSLIQNAYQGFAKQNYTMLDNLKLGYGGTKTEMERLIKDAAKLDKSVKANDMSFGNITKAIHAVQKNMSISGITYDEYTKLVESGAMKQEDAFKLLGTTAKEANFTISGSLNQVKGAWGNLLTSIGSGENLDEGFDNLLKSIEIFGNNVLPVAERALSGIGVVIEKLTPKIAEKLPQVTQKLLPPLLSAAASLLNGLIVSLPTIVKTVIKEIPNIAGQIGSAIIEGITGKKVSGDAMKGLAKMVGGIGVGLLALIPAMKGFNAIKGLFGGKGGLGDDKGGGNGGLFGGIFEKLAKTSPKIILKGMANLAIILGGLTILTAAIMLVAPHIAKLSDVQSLLEVVGVMAALGTVGMAIAQCASVVGKIPIPTVLKGLANMAIVIAGVTALVLVLGAATLIKFDYGRIMKFTMLIGALGTIGAALTVLAGIVGIIPIYVVLIGIANMAIVIAGLTSLVLLLGAATLLKFDYKRIMKLTGFLVALAAVGTALVAFAGIAGIIPFPIVVSGLANIALVLGGFTVLISAYSALANINGFHDFITKGGELLATLFNVIGKCVGSIAGGVAEGLSNALPQIGANLAAFGTAIQPMFSAFQGVDMKSVGAFFAAIGAFMLQMAGSKILDFFTGGADFSGVAEGLNTFAQNEGVKNFFNMVNTIEEAAFNKGKQFFECLDGISNLPNAGGLANLFGGKNDFTGVADGLKTLTSDGVKGFFAMVKDMEEISFNNGKQFFECLDGISNLPNAGGLANLFGGKNDFSGVAQGLTDLSSDGVKGFFGMVTGFDNSVFDKTKNLFEALADIGNVGEDGFWERVGKNITGDGNEASGITKIGKELNQFALDTEFFFRQVSNLNLNSLNGLWASLNNATLATDISNVVGDNIDEIVEKISELPKRMGNAIKSSSSSLKESIVAMWKEAVIASVAPVNKLIDGANWLLKEFGSKKVVATWTPYARGTSGHKGGNALVNDGSGAELVQMPNGQSFSPQGRNVFLPNAPKGMKVLPADKTAQLMGKSTPTFNYAKGVGNIDVWDYTDNAKGLIDAVKNNFVNYDGMKGIALHIGQGLVTTISGEMTSWADKLMEEFIGKGWLFPSIYRYISSYFGARKAPTKGASTYHQGIDIGAPFGSTVLASKGGKVSVAGWAGGYGNLVQIDHGKSWSTRYGHNSTLLVSAGQRVKQGQPIALVGSTGVSTGAHIHFEIRKNGTALNPMPLLGQGYANGGVATKPSVFGEDGAEMAIPLSSRKRNRAIGLWQKTGRMLGTYSPENTAGKGGKNVTVTHHNSYAPNFEFHIHGANDTRKVERDVKRYVREAFNEMFEMMAGDNPQLQEV